MAKYTSEFSGPEIDRRLATVDNKAGCFYYDATKNRYLVFADETARDMYLADTTSVDLIIGAFDAPFNYSAKIVLESQTYNAVALGTTGLYIDFLFDVENKNGMSTGESVVCTYTFRKGSITHSVTEQYAAGRNVHFNIDKYLTEGTNNITISIQGMTTLAATTVAVIYQVVALSVDTELDISQVYDLRNGVQTMVAPFSVAGYGTKIVEWYLDDEQLPFVKEEDEVVDVSVSRTKYITVANLAQGVHTLQMRAYTLIDGDVFYSDTLFREFIVYTGVGNEIITAIAMTVPAEYGIVSSRRLYGLVQYVPYVLNFATFSPVSSTVEVDICFDDTLLGTVVSENGRVAEFSITPSNAGHAVVSIGDSLVETDVAKTKMKIAEITNALQLDFRALGKSNYAADRDQWSYGDFKGTFKGLNWNNTSGWIDGCLLVNAGAEFGVNCAPLAGNPAQLGKTIEIEFATTGVNDDNAIVCDLRDKSSGAGILITATSVALFSEGGVVLETSFKPDEFIRVAFVINKAASATYKCMSFIHVNGKFSRGTSWAAGDRYTSTAEILFKGSADAQLLLKHIRIYDMALTADQLLDNYIIYRGSIKEMAEIYERNDIYADGTSTFEPGKMAGRLPYMIITGNVPVLEATTDKNEQIVVDIEYRNLQNPSLDFTWKNAVLRPQGTSSMGYPKKNFRPYSNKIDATVCYDASGNVVPDRLYAFKPGAQRVDCWCLKADYAESSGTHNTGIARIWNEVLMNATIDGEYVFRTAAQRAAIANGFAYDVRTTVDGFPILLFYRLTENDPLIFLGKYNFNNDKSTPSVFGFEGIPGFDNSRMQCWEVLNNGNALALFTSVTGFDTRWSEAFESRYPDTKSPRTTDLKAFCTWMTNVTPADFVTQKYEHLDVYKVAAYYIYLMRFGAVDQPVKNAMLTSEDGAHFFFILYDNDTVNGLTNEGKLVVPWDAIRPTIGADGQPYYAGPSSRLWNLLEADKEFMAIVPMVDEALYIAGLTYENVIKMFDEEQAGKWVERVFNQDALYKYVGPFVERGVDNLFMMQGDRSTHRKYWLARRFALFDSLWVSGAYKADALEIKCTNNTQAGQKITITAGTGMRYGYGINNLPRECNISLVPGTSYTFTTNEVVNLGDPIRLYAAPHIESIDLSDMTGVLAVLTIDKAYNKNVGTKLKRLVVGNSTIENGSVTSISGLAQATRLEYLDVQNMKGITSLDLSSQNYLKVLKAFGSGIASVQFANGAAIEVLELPSQTSLRLEELPYLSSFNMEDWSRCTSVTIKGCPGISNDLAAIINWVELGNQERLSLDMDNIAWEDVDYTELIKLASIGNLSLKGYARLTESSQEIVDAITGAFSSEIFNTSSDFYVDAPNSIFISGQAEVLEGESAQYTAVVFPTTLKGVVRWSLEGSRTGTSIDSNGLLTTTENGYNNSNLKVRAQFIPEEGDSAVVTKDIVVKKRIYPSASQFSISGATMLSAPETYTLQCNATDITGEYFVEWALGGDIASVAAIQSSNNNTCIVVPETVMNAVAGTINATIYKKYNNSTIGTVSFNISAVNDTIAETDAGVCAALYAAGLCANEGYITKDEARWITAEDLLTSNGLSVFNAHRDNVKSFDGFQYFTSVLEVPSSCFLGCRYLSSIILPNSIKSIGGSAFDYCQNLRSFVFPNKLEVIESSAFVSTGLMDVYFDSLSSFCRLEVKSNPWGSSTNVHIGNEINPSRIVVPNDISVLHRLFYNLWFVEEIVISDSVKTIEKYAIYGCPNLTSIKVGTGVTSIADNAISYNKKLEGIIVQEGNPVFDSRNGCKAIIKTSTNELLAGGYKSVIPEGITTICYQAFGYLEELKEIILPESLAYIDENAFIGTSINNVTIPDNTIGIGAFAFSNCKSLTSVVIGNGIKHIGWYSFRYCVNLTSISIKALIAPQLSNYVFGFSTNECVGVNTASQGINRIYVPADATGYEEGQWLDPLCNPEKCGFTLSKTL